MVSQNSTGKTPNENEVSTYLEEGFRLLIRKLINITLQEFQKELCIISRDPRKVIFSDVNVKEDTQKLTYSVTEAAELLGISKPAAYQAVKQNQIPHIKFGSRILIPRAALKKMLEDNI